MSRKRKKKAATTVVVKDGFSNPATRTGAGMPNVLNHTQYPLERKSWDYQKLTALYRNHWVIQNMVNVVPQDMLKNGYDLVTTLSPDDLDKVWSLLRKKRVDTKLYEGLAWGRLYGGAIGVMLINDMQNLDQPLDHDTLMPGCFKGILVLDRWVGVNPSSELVADLDSEELGLPKYYQVNLDEGSAVKIHHSRVLRFIGRKMPRMEEQAEQYWGTSLIEHILPELEKRDNVSWNVALLTFMANIRVMKAPGVSSMMLSGTDAAREKLYNTVSAVNEIMNSNAMMLLDENASYESHQYTFSGIGEVYDRFMMDVSGACGIPVTKLFGRSPAGMDATGESDLQNYYDRIEGDQQTQLLPVLEKLLPVIFISSVGAVPDDLQIVFNPVRRPTDDEKSDLGSKQTTAVVQAFTAGLISQQVALRELQQSSDMTGMWSNITDDIVEKADTDTQLMGEEVPDIEQALGNASPAGTTENTQEGQGSDTQRAETD